MSDVHVTVWDETGGTGDPVLFVHGIVTWGTDPLFGFAAQRPLAARHRLLLMDRRGHGASPDTERGDYRVDAGDILDVLAETGGAHLVGHTYGAVAAMLAAARDPGLVRSLTLIQPAALQVAADHPVVAATLAAARASLEAMPPGLTPEAFLRATMESVGLPPAEETPERLRAAAASLREHPAWDGDLPVAPLADAPWPKLVIIGDWAEAPREYREKAGEAVMVTARVTAERLGARLLVVPGYYPHVQRPDLVNAALEELWGNSVDARDTGGPA